jgi:hypothetical protein
MSADIAAKSNSGMPVEMKPLGATTVESGYGAAPTVAMSPLVEDRPIYASARRISSAFEDRQESQRNPAPQEYAARIARTSLEARPSPAAPRASASMATTRRVPGARLGDSLPPFPAPTHKPAKRRVFIWGAALSIFAGLCVLGGLALYQMTTRPVLVTAQPTPEGSPETDAPGFVQPRYGLSPMRPAADGPVGFSARSRPMALSDGPAPKNLERARTVIAAGDIEAVRIALSRMIESGNASAAVDLGSTYDPNILDALGIRNFPADVSKARAWYQRAQQMGSPDAAGLLESLERSERPSR